MKRNLSLLTVLAFAAAGPQATWAWTSLLDGTTLPQSSGWLLDGSSLGTIVDLGGGNKGVQQTDDTDVEYDEWYVVNGAPASTLGARFRVDSYGGGPVNILQLSTANSGGDPCPFVAVAIRDGRFYLIRVLADATGAPPDVARLADLGPVEVGVFNQAYLYVDNVKDRVRLFWNGGLRYTGVETEAAYLYGGGEGYAEFGASNFWPDNDHTGICTVTFDWVGLGDASDLPLALPTIPWARYLDGSSLPGAQTPPWQLEQGGESGDTLIVDFTDPFNGAANQAMRVNSGTGDTDWYEGAFSDDEVFAGARFQLVNFSPAGSENLISMVTRSQPLSPAPSIALVDGRFKLWSYVDSDFEIMDIGPADLNQWHTVYLYAHKAGRVKLWWDGQLIFDDLAPLVNQYDGYFEWGSGSWQRSATTTVDFDWVAYGTANDVQVLTTDPADGDIFQDPAAGFSVNVASPDGVAADGLAITLNGVDKTAELVVSGDNANRQGYLGGLLPDQLYVVVLTITEQDGDVASYTIHFDTFLPGNFMFEAEDWNFEGGQFLDEIVLASTPQFDNYVGHGAFEGIDHHELSTDPGASQHQYRDSVLVGTERNGDVLRQNYADAQGPDPDVADYNVGWVDVGEWLNYTRTFPAGTYFIYGRFAADAGVGPFEATLDKVTNPTSAAQTTTPVGAFRSGPGRGWQSYDFVPLTDGLGELVAVGLSGVETLRVTCTQGGYNANFYMVVPAKGPQLHIARSANNVVISWEGNGWILQSALSVTGSWDPVQNQTNPMSVSPTDPKRFFRLVKAP